MVFPFFPYLAFVICIYKVKTSDLTCGQLVSQSNLCTNIFRFVFEIGYFFVFDIQGHYITYIRLNFAYLLILHATSLGILYFFKITYVKLYFVFECQAL